MRFTKLKNVLASLGVVSAAVTGCGSADDSASATGKGFTSCEAVDFSKPPADPIPLRLGGATGTEAYGSWMAMAVSPKEYRPNADSWYTLENVPFPDPAQRFSAFQSGQLDGYLNSMPLALLVQEQGIDAKMVASAVITRNDTPTDPRYIVKASSDIQDFGDLEGARIGVIGLGSASELLARTGLEATGVPQDSVTFVNIPPAQHISAVEAGTVDVAIGIAPFLKPAIDSGKVRDIAGQGFGLVELEGVDYIESVGLMVGQDYLDKHPDVVCAYLADFRSTMNWLRNDLDEARRVFSEKELVALPYEVYKDAPAYEWPTGDALPSVEFYNATAPYAEKYGMIEDGSPEAVKDMVWDGLGERNAD